MTKSFFTVRGEAYGDMVARKQKLLNRSNDAYKQGDLGTMRKAHSLAMKQDSRTRAKYPDESIRSTMSGATKDYADREKKLGPGKVRDSVEYSDDTNVVAEAAVEEGIMDFMSSTPAKPKSKLSLSAMREISRREDMKKNMNKVVRGNNEPQSATYRTVRLEKKDEREYGYEGDMAMNQLKTLVRCAEMIEDCLKPDTDLPEWVQSKITLATDYIQTAADYLYSESEMNEAKKMKGKDPCWTGYHMIGTKPKGGKQVPNCVPEEVEHIDEADSARLRMAKALQKAKEDRERSERAGQKLLEPDGKEVSEPKKQKMAENTAAQRAAIAIAKQKSGKYDKEGKRIKENIDADVNEGIARLISKSIKRVTTVKPTPQQKADIRLNK